MKCGGPGLDYHLYSAATTQCQEMTGRATEGEGLRLGSGLTEPESPQDSCYVGRASESFRGQAIIINKVKIAVF